MKTALVIASLSLLGLLLAVQGSEAITLYATDNTNDGLYTIDTNGFTVTLVGVYAIGESFLGGLDFNAGGTLYGISAGSGATLYIVDPTNANTTLVGPVNVGFIFEGGLAFDPTDGTLYGVNQGSAGSPHLITIDTATGQGTVVGPIASPPHDFQGIAFDMSGQLYGLDGSTNALWRIDKSNPGGVGTVQVGGGLGGGINLGTFGGMTRDSVTETFYGYAGGSTHLFTVSTSTGLGTVLHQFDPSAPAFFSLAFYQEGPTAVESASWGAIKAIYKQ